MSIQFSAIKRAACLCTIWLLVSAFPPQTARAWPAIYPTGITLHEEGKTQEGFILFSPLGSPPGAQGSTIYLIDTNGKVRHTWSVPFSAMTGKLLPNGNIQILGQSDVPAPNRPGIGKYKMGGYGGWLIELTWDGRRVFKHIDLRMHHEFTQLPNGHFIYIAWEPVPKGLQLKVRGGIKGSEHQDGTMFNDMLIEIDRSGKTVWSWHANAHFDPNIDIISPIQKREEWCHANNIRLLANGNLLLTSRALDAFYEIEKKSGKIVRRWGNAAYIDKATHSVELHSGPNTLGAPHDANQIARGLPGAGHILCYDNGLYSASSRAVEIDITTRKLMWQSRQDGLGRKRFADFLGSSQRLSNGNTFLCDGANGHFYQLNAQSAVVWEYINPFLPAPLYQGAVFKAHFYNSDYCEKFKDMPVLESTR